MPILLAFLKSNWKMVGIGLIALAVVVYVGILKARLNHANETIEAQKSSLLLAKTVNDNLNKTIAEQSRSIRAIEAKAASAKKNGASALAKANERAVGLSEKAKFYESLLNLPDAKKKGCRDALEAFRHEN